MSNSFQKREKGFIGNLKQLINSSEYGNIIKVLDSNNGFIIINDYEFQHQILKNHFKHSNIASFKRQLNMYGFQFTRTLEGYMKFQHNQFDSRNDEGLQIRQNTLVSTLSLDQELYLLKLQLKDIQRNQQIMQKQIREIIEQQKETQKNIKKAMLDYVRIRVNGQSRGKKVGKFVWKFHINITNKKYKKFLYKKWRQANHCLENLCIEDVNLQIFKQQFYTPFLYNSIFDIKIPNFNLEGSEILQLCDNQDQNEDSDLDKLEVQSVSNISNYLNL
ncbi:unnamed protein product [Paramecium sonneborni]|uniref:HSF-type DNA-binding domain-containing protein n=1 Tax=Paramecium sonneborni TaxID=65129 RepID=A0A8S1M239_9CILI|nr:unnamed protein product [Paramecium sonneborni]CAD8073928.1 unnamed protein product [Paramecium sonneborni]